ncbi:MAG: carboxypeptidase regulatory-like domain-containing protein [Ferruginibacter sp.]
MRTKIRLLLSIFIVLGFVSKAQVTTSSLAGVVTSSDKKPLVGATVTATHTASGTKYTTVTQKDGNYLIQGMRAGGPYTVEISFVGYGKREVTDINLTLGDTYVVNEALAEAGKELTTVVVVGTRGKNTILNSDRTGASTNISNKQLNSLATISRSLTDFTRLTPQANGTSFGGRDNRMNAVKIDGAILNNGFGLSSDLLPGGDAQPISLDAIQEVQVNVAPYDVRQTGFTGAGVNAVTRSGTNKFTGSVYGFYRNQDFAGVNVDKAKLTKVDLSNKVYGARIGGPIIKNKLFFFANFEKSNYVYPGNTWKANRGTAGPDIARTTAADLDAVSNFLKSEYNYDPGKYEGYADQYANKDTKFLIRFDFNISQKHKLTVRYNQVVGTSDQGTNAMSGPNPRSATARISSESIAFENANYKLSNKVRSATLELNSILSSKISNQFLATYSYIESIRSTPGELFPFVDIWQDGKNYMSFGTELFSLNNGLKNNNFSFIDNVTITKGKHSITTGASFETMGYDNSFVRMGTSYYRYNSVQDFLDKKAPSVFGVTYPYQNDTWAKVRFGMAGIYVQDKITVNNKLNITAGLRVDMPLYMDKPLHNPTVDTLKLLDQDGNQKTYSTAKWPKSRPLFSPRIGVNYDVFGDRSLQLRGGTGIFTGLMPFVWLTNQPTNSGVLQNTLEPVSNSTLALITGFNKDPYYWVNQLPNSFPKTPSSKAPSSLALVDDDFKMPQVWRTNIGADYKIPNTPFIASLDILYTKDINAIYQFNANRKAATSKLNYSGDNREYWVNVADATYNPGTGAIAAVLSNTSKGHSMAISAGVTVPNWKGLSGSLFYTYTAAKDVTGNPGSSANSAWSNNYSINDPNELLMGQSQYAIPHRVVGNISYRVEYARHLATTFSLFYQGSKAGRFAYTYGGDINKDGVSLDLLYVPKSASEINFAAYTSGGVTFSKEQQAAAFETFINNVPELKKARGGYVERNSGLLPWNSRFDVRILQDIFTNIGKYRHSLQFSVDILNFANLLNSSWGLKKELNNGGIYNYALLNVASVTPQGVPTFNMNNITNAAGTRELPTTPYRNWFGFGNTWSMQLGLRYNF